MTIEVNDLVDFTYCGKKLSDYGCVVGGLSAGGLDTTDIGNKLNMNAVGLPFLKKQKSVYPTYDDMLKSTITIIKDPCNVDPFFTHPEAVEIMRWLNQPKYREFIPEYSRLEWDAHVHYYVTFNVQALTVGSSITGFSLEMESNAPFGYYDPVDITNNTSTLTINDMSDEQGYVYPIMKIEVVSAGNIVITNTMEKRYTVIDNCEVGEIITLDGEKGSIVSENAQHKTLYNDFNYFYPRIWNKMDDNGLDSRENIFAVKADAALIKEVIYAPICKIYFV